MSINYFNCFYQNIKKIDSQFILKIKVIYAYLPFKYYIFLLIIYDLMLAFYLKNKKLTLNYSFSSSSRQFNYSANFV